MEDFRRKVLLIALSEQHQTENKRNKDPKRDSFPKRRYASSVNVCIHECAHGCMRVVGHNIFTFN